MVPVFPVENTHNFQSGKQKHVFRDCFLVRSGTTVSDVISKIDRSLVGRVEYAVDVHGKRLGIDAEITESNNIFKLVVRKHEPPPEQQ
jgi:ribosome-interacting GTPase 1